MRHTQYVLLLGSLLLASCNQSNTPVSNAETNQETAASVIRNDLQEFKDLRQKVIHGEVAQPVDSDGNPVDMAALIAQVEADLANPLVDSLVLPGQIPLNSQAAYPQSTYINIAGDKNFTSNLGSYKHKYPKFNWHQDGCSIPGLPDKFSKYIVFHPACVRHDFGYRNVKAYKNLMHEDHRGWVDGKFKEYMRLICSKRNIFLKPGCYVDAEAFWGAVRHFGRNAFYH